MSMRKPPALAAWLLRRVWTGSRGESFLGDLFEEYQTGRAPGWYWRETLIALIICAQRGAVAFLSRRTGQVVLTLIGQSALLGWLVAMSQQYRRNCPAPSVHLSGASILVTSATLAEVAIALMLCHRSLLRPVRTIGRRGMLRVAIVAFAAIGFTGGAVTWASTTSCPAPIACPTSSATISCLHAGNGNSDGPKSVTSNHPRPLLARNPGGSSLRSR